MHWFPPTCDHCWLLGPKTDHNVLDIRLNLFIALIFNLFTDGDTVLLIVIINILYWWIWFLFLLSKIILKLLICITNQTHQANQTENWVNCWPISFNLCEPVKWSSQSKELEQTNRPIDCWPEFPSPEAWMLCMAWMKIICVAESALWNGFPERNKNDLQ